VGVRRRGGADRAPGGGADRRRGGAADVLADRAADARAGDRDGPAVLVRLDLEQLLPPADHAQGSRLVPAHGRHQPVEQARLHRGQRRVAAEPRPDVVAAHDRAADHRVRVPAAVLAGRAEPRRRQGLSTPLHSRLHSRLHSDREVTMDNETTLPALRVDGTVPAREPLRHVWNECVGAGRANEALRADWQAHFSEAVTALGARYVRFHGLFHDDMFVYRADDGGGFGPAAPLAEPVHTFSYVDKVFDFILATGARPFVELGFMPRALATET